MSTGDQTTLLQTQELERYGCDEIITEVGSGANAERPELLRLLRRVRAGDILIVWKLDRLGRSLSHLVETVRALEDQGVHFVSLRDAIDTSSAGGRLYFVLMCALAEFERDLIVDRVNAGLAAARSQGRIGGRPVVVTPAIAEQANALLKKGVSPTQAALDIGISRSAFYKAIRYGVIRRPA